MSRVQKSTANRRLSIYYECSTDYTIQQSTKYRTEEYAPIERWARQVVQKVLHSAVGGHWKSDRLNATHEAILLHAACIYMFNIEFIKQQHTQCTIFVHHCRQTYTTVQVY